MPKNKLENKKHTEILSKIEGQERLIIVYEKIIKKYRLLDLYKMPPKLQNRMDEIESETIWLLEDYYGTSGLPEKGD